MWLRRYASGVYDVVREKSATYGLKLIGETRLPAHLGTFGGYVAVVEGKSDRDLDGNLDRRLPALNITPPKVSLYWDKPGRRASALACNR